MFAIVIYRAIPNKRIIKRGDTELVNKHKEDELNSLFSRDSFLRSIISALYEDF